MKVDVLYLAWNRLAFTRASFAALLEHTNWDHVRNLVVHDDASTDGTAEWLAAECGRFYAATGKHVRFDGRRLGGPVAAMNDYLDRYPGGGDDDEVGAFCKIDSDFVVCPGWLDETLRVAYLEPAVNALGIAPMHGPPVLKSRERTIERARHIGGIGLIRHRAFEACRPVPRGLYGWTEFQRRHRSQVFAWLNPDLPCFELDRLPFEPWASLAEQYQAEGWQRRWGVYDDTFTGYWAWWTEALAAA